ncbi:MAG: hypothetical protein JOZ75_05230 [Candidatus Dormibacteraeota bacterium]|nr:hypothetical protein [Candidatus Dormibacteraeota bacterium]
MRSELVAALAQHDPILSQVFPQQDGSVGVALTWRHPDQDEPEWIEAPMALREAPLVYLRLVENPDEWRAERIG